MTSPNSGSGELTREQIEKFRSIFSHIAISEHQLEGVGFTDTLCDMALSSLAARSRVRELEGQVATLREALGKISYLDYHQDGECKDNEPERCIGHIAHKALNPTPTPEEKEK